MRMRPPARARLAVRRRTRSLAVVVVAMLAVGMTLSLGASAAAQVVGERRVAECEDVVTSEDVKCVGNIPIGDGVGARVVGDYLYATTTLGLEIFDLSDPANPVRTGATTVDVQFENEEVPTNGEVLGISAQTPSLTSEGLCPSGVLQGCLIFFDVRDKTAPEQIATVLEAGDHTSTCILDCSYTYGSSGSIVDLRGIFDGVEPKKLDTNWIESIIASGASPDTDCHNQNEVRPGVILVACDPMYLLSVNAEDGGSITEPAILGGVEKQDGSLSGANSPVHGVEWAQGGTDRIMLSASETNGRPVCTDDVGALSTFVVGGAPATAPTFTLADIYRPVSGTIDNGSPLPGTYQLGCSVHWFKLHPTFDDGGLVALGAYENGTRFLEITPTGEIVERGYFLPVRGATSAPHWAPDGRHVYAIDYERGIDILRYDGPLYVPTEVGRVGGDPEGDPDGDPDGETEGEPGGGDSDGETAVSVSRTEFDSAETVVLGRNDLYPDSLTGGPLAASLDAPILLTDSNELTPATEQEIERLGARRVVLLGGVAAISDDVADRLRSKGLTVDRVGGANRFATAALVADELGGAGDTAFIAEGASADAQRGWPDPIAVAPYAAYRGDPILLTASREDDSIPQETDAALRELGISETVVVGGDAAVSDRLVSELNDAGYTTRRLAGATRYETSRAVYEESVEAGMDPSTLWLATGTDWPDALVSGPVVAARGETMALVDGHGGPDTKQEILAAHREALRRVRLVGGGESISAEVEQEIRNAVRQEPSNSEQKENDGDVAKGLAALALLPVGGALIGRRRRSAPSTRDTAPH